MSSRPTPRKKRVALVHTVSSIVPGFGALCAELIPTADIFNIVDESLLQDCLRQGQLTRPIARRLVAHVISAEQAGAEIIMVTCSSMGLAIEASRPLVGVPVLRVDEPMANQAIALGQRIGVVATLRTTLDPTVSIIRTRAEVFGKEVEVKCKLCEGAFEAVMAGDAASHDAIVTAGLRELVADVDVVVLAQASMARVVETLPKEDWQIPILSSPRLAVEHLATLL